MSNRSEIEERINILTRICIRGRSYFLDKGDSRGIDMFEHMENEVRLLEKAVDAALATKPAVNIADIRTLLEIGREAYSDVYVFVHGEDDNHYDALDAAIMAVLAAKPATHPARGVVDEDVVIQAERAFWPAYNEALRVHGTKADCHAIGMRAALQAAALPAAPDAAKWAKKVREFSWRLDAHEQDIADELVAFLESFAATPAHDQPEGSDNE